MLHWDELWSAGIFKVMRDAVNRDLARYRSKGLRVVEIEKPDVGRVRAILEQKDILGVIYCGHGCQTGLCPITGGDPEYVSEHNYRPRQGGLYGLAFLDLFTCFSADTSIYVDWREGGKSSLPRWPQNVANKGWFRGFIDEAGAYDPPWLNLHVSHGQR
jgi:hypothetical protein